MEAAIGMDDLAGAVVEVAIGDGPDDVGDVGGLAHAALGEEAAGDFFVVDLFHFGDHVGADDAGLDFENLNAFRGQTLGVDEAGHADACFGDAVFGAVDGGGEG